MRTKPPSPNLVPLDVIADELDRLGWPMTGTEVNLFTKAFLLGFTLGRDERGVMADEAKLRANVTRLFEAKRRYAPKLP